MAFMEVLKFPARSTFPATGDNNRLYVDLQSKRIYYWDQGAYQIASPNIVEQGSNPISEAFSFAGIVPTVADLPTEGNSIGDVYIVEQDEDHEQDSAYVWSGTKWIEIGGYMEHIVATSWTDLKALRDAGLLTPGQQYRITDYVTTTAQANTQSAGHQFDIIVTADDVDKLNENARACLHEGDTYFANSKLEAWKLKYCLDNDTNRFAWADSVNGKGVIYRMIDEFNNDVPYDFKNIQYQIRPSFIYSQWGNAYVFSRNTALDMIIADVQYYGYVSDRDISGWSTRYCWLRDDPATTSSVMYTSSGAVISFGGNIVTISNESYDVYTFSKTKTTANDFDVSLNGLLYSCHNNTIRPYVVIGANKYQVLNRITFVGWFMATSYPGLHCHSNTFGNDCHSNTFGNSCQSNTFGNGCYYNTFGYSCQSNTFGNYCSSNTFGNNCRSNTFGNYCSSNSFGNGCSSNNFGNYCSYNTFGTSCTYNTFGNECRYLQISDTSSTPKRYIHVDNGVQGASSANKFDLYDLAILNKDYQVTFKKTANNKYLMLWATDTGAMTGKYKALNTDLTWTDL